MKILEYVKLDQRIHAIDKDSIDEDIYKWIVIQG